MNEIRVKDFISGDVAISYEDGKKCLKKMLELLDNSGNDQGIVLDFSEVDYVITAFLNPVIGDLILERGLDIMKRVKIEGANTEIIKKIKQVKNGTLLKREDLNG